MASSVKDDVGESSDNFEDYVWPHINHWFVDGNLESVEDREDKTANTLDSVSGVDHWVIESNGLGISSIASRVQTSYDLPTHTVRYERQSGAETEYQKRCHQVNEELDYPKWTAQAYVNVEAETLLNAAIVKTQPFYEWLSGCEPEWFQREKVYPKYNEGWARMFVVEWSDMWEIYDRSEFKILRPERAGVDINQSNLDDWDNTEY